MSLIFFISYVENVKSNKMAMIYCEYRKYTLKYTRVMHNKTVKNNTSRGVALHMTQQYLTPMSLSTQGRKGVPESLTEL